jgi:hypothetical protein
MLYSLNKSVSCQALKAHFLRRNRHFPNQFATFQKQRQFGHGQLDVGDIFATPELGKSALLDPLGVQTQSCPIPQEHFRSATVTGDKQKQVARQGILIEVAFHHAEEAVEAFAHVGGLSVGKDPYGPSGTDHGRTLRR